MAQHEACIHENDFGSIRTSIDGIQETLKELKDLLVSNATLSAQYMQARNDIDNLAHKIRTVELNLAKMSGSKAWLDKAVWAILAAAITAYVTTHMGHILGG